MHPNPMNPGYYHKLAKLSDKSEAELDAESEAEMKKMIYYELHLVEPTARKKDVEQILLWDDADIKRSYQGCNKVSGKLALRDFSAIYLQQASSLWKELDGQAIPSHYYLVRWRKSQDGYMISRNTWKDALEDLREGKATLELWVQEPEKRSLKAEAGPAGKHREP